MGLPAGFQVDLKIAVLAWRQGWRFVLTHIEEWGCEEFKFSAFVKYKEYFFPNMIKMKIAIPHNLADKDSIDHC